MNGRAAEAARVCLLLDAPSVGPRRAIELLERHGSAAAAIVAVTDAPQAPERLRRSLADTDPAPYQDSIRRTVAAGGDFLLWSDRQYPSNLARWAARPPILFYRGDLSRLGPRSLALVGRVDPSPAGRDAAARFAAGCVEHGITVVSGLARGVDGAAHRAALDAGGWTYAVLGHGLDHTYPRDNAQLYKEIPERGALISQFRTGVGPQRWTFPLRNEVMCTLALGTVIVESQDRCGSLIQADFSFKHGRPVFLLKRNLQDAAPWATDLLRRGAHVIERFEEVIEVVDATLGGHTGQAASQPAPSLFDAEQPAATPEPTPDRDMAVLFDLDGVIIDTRGATAAALATLATAELGHEVSAATLAPYVTRSPAQALAAVGVGDAYATYRRAYDGALAQAIGQLTVFQPVVDGIRRLLDAGVKVGLVTSQPRRRLAAMLPAALADRLATVVAYGDARPKPAPDGILRALQAIGVEPARAVYVGDTPNDLLAARKAGVTAVAVTWGFADEVQLRRYAPDLILTDPSAVGSDLLAALPGR
jgi:DNA protecting protein DprA